MPVGKDELSKFSFYTYETDVSTNKHGIGEIDFKELHGSELPGAYISCGNNDEMKPGWLIEQTPKHLLFKAKPSSKYHWTCHVRVAKGK